MQMLEISIRTLDECPTLVLIGKVEVGEVPAFLERAFHAVATHAPAAGVEITGAPFARYRLLDPQVPTFEVEAGFPVSGAPTASDDVRVSSLPAGPAAVAWHIGRYEAMTATYDALHAFLEGQHAEPLGAAWEVYHSDPSEEPNPATWRTEVVQPFMA
jgi:effector-binding domain-containing protein